MPAKRDMFDRPLPSNASCTCGINGKAVQQCACLNDPLFNRCTPYISQTSSIRKLFGLRENEAFEFAVSRLASLLIRALQTKSRERRVAIDHSSALC
jgi:hypothetical protein